VWCRRVGPNGTDVFRKSSNTQVASSGFLQYAGPGGGECLHFVQGMYRVDRQKKIVSESSSSATSLPIHAAQGNISTEAGC
jgi:hypothetical protein